MTKQIKSLYIFKKRINAVYYIPELVIYERTTDMTITQMKYYVTVCEKKSFSKAARELGVSQPAVSFAVKELEEASGVALVKRGKGGVSVTDEGEVLYQSLLPILDQIDSLSATMKDLHLERKFVRVGFTTMMGNYAYSKILAMFIGKHPDIQVIGYEDSTGKLKEMLSDGALDVALLAAEKSLDKCHMMDIEKTGMMFCVHKEHPFAEKKSVTWEEMGSQPLILLTDRFSFGARIERNFMEHGVQINVIHRTDQPFTVERFIENGAAAGFLPGMVAKNNPHIVGLQYLPEEQSAQYLRAVWPKNTYQFDSVTRYIETVSEYARESAGMM